MTTATYPIISDDPDVQAFYEERRDAGVSHNFAEMVALQQPPGASDDTTYMRGVGTLLDQCNGDEAEVNRLVKASQKFGFTPNMNSLYNPTLARCLGDPMAFVPAANPKAHVRKVCESRGKDCEGLVNYKAPQRDTPPPPGPGLNPRIVNEEVKKAVKLDPGLPQRKGAIENLRHEIVQKHGFKLDAHE